MCGDVFTITWENADNTSMRSGYGAGLCTHYLTILCISFCLWTVRMGHHVGSPMCTDWVKGETQKLLQSTITVLRLKSSSERCPNSPNWLKWLHISKTPLSVCTCRSFYSVREFQRSWKNWFKCDVICIVISSFFQHYWTRFHVWKIVLF